MMYSIEFESDLIKGVKLIDIELLNPHEKIIERKKTSLAKFIKSYDSCLLYTSPSPRDATLSRMPSSA